MIQGTTRLLITRIPFFREVVISSFECKHCGFTNRSVDPAAPIQKKGKRFTLDVRCSNDLDRRVIQPSHSEIRIPSLDSSFPNSEAGLFYYFLPFLLSLCLPYFSAHDCRRFDHWNY